VCSARRPADWSRPPPEPRSARYPAPRPARRAVWMRRALTQTSCRVSPCLHTRGAWADGGVPRAAGVRRRACQAREDGGPGSERPEGTTHPFLSLPARKLRARREQPQLNDARRDGREVEARRRPIRRRRALDLQAQEKTQPFCRRRGHSRSNAGEGAAVLTQGAQPPSRRARAPFRGSLALDAMRRPRSLQWRAQYLAVPSSRTPPRCHS